MGRPRKYFSEEERKEAHRPIKTRYMVNKVWICSVCGDKDYSLAGKWCHLKTQKHIKNEQAAHNNEK